MRLTKSDKELIEQASNVVKNNADLYGRLDLHVAVALKTKSGKVFVGLNIKTSHSICAESVAIASAFANGEREFDTIVAVRLSKDGTPYVVSPCGVCRYTFDQLGLSEMNVILPETEKKLTKIKARELLPYLFKAR